MHSKWILIIGLILALALAGAGCVTPSDTDEPDAGDGQEEPSTTLSEEEQQVIVNDFEALLAGGMDEKAAIAEIKNDLPLLSVENISKIVIDFENYQKAVISQGGVITQELTDLIGTDYRYNEDTINQPDQIAEADLQAAIQDLLDRGYKITVPEGMYEAVINYGAYLDFADYATDDIRDYIKIKAAESDQRMSEDAGLIISADEVYARAVATEEFLGSYPDSVKYGDVKQMHDNYVSAYFYGQNNTPAFDYFTDPSVEAYPLYQEFRDSYEAAAADSANNAIARATLGYLTVLEDNNYALTDAVSEYRDNMVAELNGSEAES